MEPAGSEKWVVVVGTAHVIDLAAPLEAVFRRYRPDAVAIELDRARADALLSPVSRSTGRGGDPIFLRLWGLVQRRLGAEIGSGGAGDEMKAAATRALAGRIPLYLIDDPVAETVLRLVQQLSFKERIQLLLGGVAGLFLPARWVRREVDRYSSDPDEYIAAMRSASPQLARVLIDDRNQRMADRIVEIVQGGSQRLLVVVGDAHRMGIETALQARGLSVVGIPFGELQRLTGP
jgi:pheromone shutdown protein TraB